MQPNVVENSVQATIHQEETEKKLPDQSTQIDSQSKNDQEPAEDPNWRAFREARKQDRIQREAAEKRAAEKEQEVAALKAAMEAAFSRGTPVQSNQPQNVYGFDDVPSEEERIQKMVEAALAAKEEQYRRENEEREAREFPQRLASTYQDFNSVTSQENLDYLDYHYPEVSKPLQRLPNGYDKWADIYRAVKKFVPNHANAKKDSMRAENNLSKPQSMSSSGTSHAPTGRGPIMLTEERRAANWERMQKTLKGLSQ